MKNGDENEEKEVWTVRDAKVNLAALLNDPRKVRRDHDLFSKTWGEGFKELPASSIPSSNPRYIAIPNVPKFSFNGYLTQTKDKFLRHQSQFVKTHQESSAKAELPDNELFDHENHSRFRQGMRSHGEKNAKRSLMDIIPKMFLQSSFKLEDEKTFTSVLNFDDRAPNKRSSTGQTSHVMMSSKLLQEKLSYYLDLVEEAIVRRISSRSESFFDAMKSHDDLNDYLKTMSTAVTKMRTKMASTRGGVSDSTLKIIQLQSKRQSRHHLLRTLHTMITVHQAQPTIQLLLSTSEYAGAFDLIETTQDVLRQELAGLHCFRHLSSQLSEIQNVIFHMMKEELSNCINTDIHRPLSEGINTVNPNHLMAIALGLLRRKKLIFLEDFREEVKLEIKTIIKDTVLEACDSAENTQNDDLGSKENEETDDSRTLAERMRNLDFEEWIKLLVSVFQNLSLFLRRIKSFLTVIVNVACMSYPTSLKRNLSELFSEEIETEGDTGATQQRVSVSERPRNFSADFATGIDEDGINGDDGALDDMDQYEMQLMESVSGNSVDVPSSSEPTKNDDSHDVTEHDSANTNTDDSNADNLLTEKDHDGLMISLCQTLAWTADFSQDRCVKVIIAKNKNSSLDKLTSLEFLTLTQSIEQYLADTEKILFEKNGENFTQDAQYFVEYFTESFGNALRGASVLRGVLQSHASQFITRFHDERKTKLSLLLNNETWRQAEVPVELSEMLRNLYLPNSKPGEVNNTKGSTSSALVLDGVEFCVAGTVLLLLKMVSEYVNCGDDLPHALPDLISRVAELLTLFNSRTCQLVLGAGALQTAGLKTISTRNLGLASRCLQLVLHLLPSIRRLFEERLVKYTPPSSLAKQQKGLKHFNHVVKAYEEHVSEIDTKLVSIMDSVIEGNLSQWQIKAPTPSKEFRFICRQMEKLFETINGLLPDVQIKEIVRKMHIRFKKRLQLKLIQYDVRNDGGPQFGLVMSDVTFYQKNLKNLKLFHDSDFSIDSVWR